MTGLFNLNNVTFNKLRLSNWSWCQMGFVHFNCQLQDCRVAFKLERWGGKWGYGLIPWFVGNKLNWLLWMTVELIKARLQRQQIVNRPLFLYMYFSLSILDLL